MMNSSPVGVDHEGHRHTTRIFIIPPPSFTLTGRVQGWLLSVGATDRSSFLACVVDPRARLAWPACLSCPPSVGRSGGRPLIRKYFRREIIALFDQGRNNGEERGRKRRKNSLGKNPKFPSSFDETRAPRRLSAATLHSLSSLSLHPIRSRSFPQPY